jgi:hypothetical protein
MHLFGRTAEMSSHLLCYLHHSASLMTGGDLFRMCCRPADLLQLVLAENLLLLLLYLLTSV